MINCIVWQGKKNKDGYAMLGAKSVHRISWEKANGSIPSGLSILHKCDNRACINHHHLFIGTQRDNNLDMDAKGRRGYRGIKGSKNYNSKLTEDKVKEILKSSLPKLTLARKYGVSQAAIQNIFKRKSWRHVI